MTERMTIPCAHLIESDPPRCDIGRVFPSECRGCAAYLPGIHDSERTRCEVWDRVMGYHRPVTAWNAGKQAEYAERKRFEEPR